MYGAARFVQDFFKKYFPCKCGFPCPLFFFLSFLFPPSLVTQLQAGIEYFEELQRPMSRVDAQAMVDAICELVVRPEEERVGCPLLAEVVGGMRRGKQQVKDVDLLIRAPTVKKKEGEPQINNMKASIIFGQFLLFRSSGDHSERAF